MKSEVFDLYCDYLLSSFGQTTATGLSALTDGQLSHDAITRMLSSQALTSKDYWRVVKPLVRQIESPDGVLIVDDSIEAKPHTDENDIICWHYDHVSGKNIKGINFISALYESGLVALVIDFRLVSKTEQTLDKATGKIKRRSPISKNEHFRNMVEQATINTLKFKYVLSDVWFASSEDISFIKKKLQKDIIMPCKVNRRVALSYKDKHNGQYVSVETLCLEAATVREIYLEHVDFPLLLTRQVFTNEDGSQGSLYLISSDTTLTYDQITTTYKRRWRVEVYHKSLKQNASLVQSPTQTITTQTNHFVAALCAYCKLEMMRVSSKLNHTALKMKLYISATQTAFKQLRHLNVVKFLPTA